MRKTNREKGYCKFFQFLLSLNSQKRLGYKENNTKYRSLTRKPRSNVRILIYRTWPIIIIIIIIIIIVISSSSSSIIITTIIIIIIMNKKVWTMLLFYLIGKKGCQFQN